MSQHWKGRVGDLSVVGQVTFSLLGAKLEGKKQEEEEGAERNMASSISFIQANLQHNTAATRILTRTVKCQRNRHGTNTGTVVS